MDLSEIRVLDLTRLLPGPYATQLLSDFGCEIVKVEDPEMGDYARAAPPIKDGVGMNFATVNAGKKSVTLDLKDEAGREAFYALVDSADVVFEQFRPGVADRLCIGYDDIVEHNPDVVYCSLSGYGQSGPHRDRVGHDLNYVGHAGMLDMTRPDPDADPTIPGYPVGDMAGGLVAAFGIVSALLSRELAGQGTYLDVAMTDAVASFSQAIASRVFAGEDPRPGETSLTGEYPWYDIYETADGQYVTFAALEPKFWREFCETVNREDLIKYHGTDDRAERAALRDELAGVFRSKTRAEWSELADEDIMIGVVNTPAEALSDPQLTDRDLITDGEFRRVRNPVRSPDLGDPPSALPNMGEHTQEVLREVGYDNEAIARLREGDIV
jgi:crotonobetainyl-CoA:carnitine CoA-transferase CaiB-like acyl-CoA transferase